MKADSATSELLAAAFFAQQIDALASALIGCSIFLDGCGGRIVETEAYDSADPASHSFRGPTARTSPMYGPPGHAYVYLIYGAHWCLNIVGGLEPGAAVLIRGLEPSVGLGAMAARRGSSDPMRLCSGPGRLCQALGITGAQNGLPLTQPPFAFVRGQPTGAVVAGPRIGLTKAADRPRRFGLVGSPFLSKPFR